MTYDGSNALRVDLASGRHLVDRLAIVFTSMASATWASEAMHALWEALQRRSHVLSSLRRGGGPMVQPALIKKFEPEGGFLWR